LPQDGIVEVACLVDGSGIQPHPLRQIAGAFGCASIRATCPFSILAVTAFLEKDREMALHALMIDPLTAASLFLA